VTQYELPALKIIGSSHIERWLDAHPQRVFDLVRNVYVTHAEGKTVNPDSYFLRFPDSDRNRIIALPASIEDNEPIAGIKWISSFPENVAHGIDRASALLILNDRRTGYPLACIEGSSISAARTAASAAVGAQYLHSTPGEVKQLGIIGCGPIAFRAVSLLVQLGWNIGALTLADLSEERAQLFSQKCQGIGLNGLPSTVEETIQTSDMMIFATSAVTPSIEDLQWFSHAPTVLHMSLRDLSPDIVAASQNVADDVQHCLKANTSLDLAYRRIGNDHFIDGDISALIGGRIQPDLSRARIFSPFGMGVLDLAVARDLVKTITDRDTIVAHDFFPAPYTVSRSESGVAARKDGIPWEGML
jgi:N-[(2S)-2-amino-2-carboxyethyl]-L-glutamate dehydrogenase